MAVLTGTSSGEPVANGATIPARKSISIPTSAKPRARRIIRTSVAEAPVTP